MNALHLDIETFSSYDLQTCGVYKYAEAPDFDILLFGYAVDGGTVQVIDLTNGESIPPDILHALIDATITKWAFNAQFERVCLSAWLRKLGLLKGDYLNPTSWHCAMVWSATMGLPLSLEGVGAVLGLEKQKLTEGKELIRLFCQPCKPTDTNNQRVRNLPGDAPDLWATFKAYNQRDVEVEMAIQSKLARFPVPENIWEEYQLDQQINDRGVLLDSTLVTRAIQADEQSRKELTTAMQELTDLDNPNSVQQMKTWLAENGLETDTLGKKVVLELLKTAPEPLRTVLTLRQQLAKSSVRKYQAMANCACADSRARGLFQFYGANRTGRFSGRLLQPQNFPQNHMPDLKEARVLLRQGNYPALSMLYDSVPNVLSELTRTAFVPRDGCRFIVADFASIERVVLAWLAGERWVLEAYEQKKDLYIATASQMFRVPIEQIDKKSPLRQRAKISDLANGYSGGVGALKAMGALDMGLAEDELQPLVTAWRKANPHIVRFWGAVERAVMQAIRERTETQISQPGAGQTLRFTCQSGMLFITLPSGRRLVYVKPRIEPNRFGRDSVTYEGIGTTKKWERIDSFGGKFVENIVQAVSRDILCNALQTLSDLSIVMHVHDEVVIEAEESLTVAEVCQRMAQTPPWAKGLPLRAEGYACNFYQKD